MPAQGLLPDTTWPTATLGHLAWPAPRSARRGLGVALSRTPQVLQQPEPVAWEGVNGWAARHARQCGVPRCEKYTSYTSSGTIRRGANANGMDYTPPCAVRTGPADLQWRRPRSSAHQQRRNTRLVRCYACSCHVGGAAPTAARVEKAKELREKL